MLAYPAYGLVVLHVLTGPSLSRQSLMPTALLGLGAAWLTAVHLWAAVSTRRRERHPEPQDGWVDVGPAGEIPMDRARVVHLPGGASAAVFRHAGGLSAVTNRCTHQGGPLGEGQIVDGCITCPWHGYQFRPHDGCSPPPYTEKIATHELRLSAGRVQLRVLPNAPGTPVQPIAAEVGS
jgi:nitrite reductase/ring-hydroxylating ferredoxin subunit